MSQMQYGAAARWRAQALRGGCCWLAAVGDSRGDRDRAYWFSVRVVARPLELVPRSFDSDYAKKARVAPAVPRPAPQVALAPWRRSADLVPVRSMSASRR